MAIQIRKAERKKAKLRLGIAAPSGAGKTYSSLLLAMGIGGKIGMIDTENGSGDLYAHLGDYDIIGIRAPFTTKKYIEAIHAFEDEGYDTIIIDGLTHAWAGDGGLLDKQGKIADADKYKNSYTAWRQVTPDHNQLVDAMLQSTCHIIATVRSKTAYDTEKDSSTGKTKVVKLGLAPVQREGMEYEFTVFLDMNQEHFATATKDRTEMFDGVYTKVDKKVGQRLLAWLNAGKDEEPEELEVDPQQQALDYHADMLKAEHVDTLKAIFGDAWGSTTDKAIRAEHQRIYNSMKSNLEDSVDETFTEVKNDRLNQLNNDVRKAMEA